jgi:hypothetical protein
MVLPNGIIAGVNKAGTTAVFHALAQQENVAVSSVKETHFFDALQYGEPLPDLSKYQALFPAHTDAPAIVEGTPSYFYGREPLAQGINAALPGVRIVVILREPGARAYSLWRFARSRLRIPADLSFRAYLERCQQLGDEPQTKRGLSGWRALSGGMYSRYLPAWQNTFDSRLLIAFYDDVRSDFEGSMERICAHFGVARIADTQPSAEHNVTTDVNSGALQRLALAINNAGEELWRKSPRLKAALRSTYYLINAKKVQQEGMSPDDRRWLDDYFREEIERLRDLTAGLQHRPAWLAADPTIVERASRNDTALAAAQVG